MRHGSVFCAVCHKVAYDKIFVLYEEYLSAHNCVIISVSVFVARVVILMPGIHIVKSSGQYVAVPDRPVFILPGH